MFAIDYYKPFIMDNKITLNIEETLKLDDNSITDNETIRQIGLITTNFGIKISNDERKQLARKVKKEYQFVGLYPHLMKKFNIKPE